MFCRESLGGVCLTSAAVLLSRSSVALNMLLALTPTISSI